MDGIKQLLKSKKFTSAILTIIIMAAEVSILKDKPEIMELVVSITAGVFGIQIAGQAHADANDPKYKSKK